MKGLLGGVDVLVLVNDQMPEISKDGVADLWPVQLGDGARDLLAVGEEPVFLQRGVVALEHAAERVLELGGDEELILHDVEVL